MVNVNKLRGRIVEKGLTIEQVAKKLGVNASTVYRKLANNGEGLTVGDANRLCKILELTGAEATAIFFSQVVA